jgi:hypothetical protein
MGEPLRFPAARGTLLVLRVANENAAYMAVHFHL